MGKDLSEGGWGRGGVDVKTGGCRGHDAAGAACLCTSVELSAGRFDAPIMYRCQVLKQHVPPVFQGSVKITDGVRCVAKAWGSKCVAACNQSSYWAGLEGLGDLGGGACQPLSTRALERRRRRERQGSPVGGCPPGRIPWSYQLDSVTGRVVQGDARVDPLEFGACRLGWEFTSVRLAELTRVESSRARQRRTFRRIVMFTPLRSSCIGRTKKFGKIPGDPLVRI